MRPAARPLARALLGAATTGLLATSLVALDAAVLGDRARPVEASGGWTTPTRPDDCSRDQLRSGAVSGCVVRERGSAGDRGFGYPPDPTTTPGFTFNGWSYSGPGERAWADEIITSNRTAVAGRGAGSLRMHVVAAPLLEGFLNEIHARGYRVGSAGAYIFRCTSSSRGNCSGGSMSNHAWGLAVDINPGTNPERTYVATETTSACAVPQVTDIPRWVVQVAESWGLYWGGYGWESGGCSSPDDDSDRVRRDPHHFEFRGTVDTALAIAKRRGVPLRSMWCETIVAPDGQERRACNQTGTPGARWRTPVPIDPPTGATAVLVSLTATGARAAGHLTVEPCAEVSASSRATSNLNVAAGRDVANVAIVPIGGATERVCVWRSAATHSVVDVLGYLADRGQQPAAQLIEPTTSTRIADTRRSGYCDDRGCVAGPVPARRVHRVPLDGTTDAIANLTVVSGPHPGHATSGTCSALGVGTPSTSNVNFGVGEARASAVFLDAEAAATCVFTLTDAHVILDVTGRLGEQGAGVRPHPARRVLDTRRCDRSTCPAPGRGSVTRLPGVVPSGGAVVNLTVTQPAGDGHATIDDCAALRAGTTPRTSTVNYRRGDTVANTTFAFSSSSDLCVYTHAAAHLVVDVQAAITADSATGVLLATPRRAADTR